VHYFTLDLSLRLEALALGRGLSYQSCSFSCFDWWWYPLRLVKWESQILTHTFKTVKVCPWSGRLFTR